MNDAVLEPDMARPALGSAHRQAPVVLPRHGRGMRIGLFGGTFNPPHEGHRLASLVALRRLKLDAIWWLVTPGNPLKENAELPPLETRVKAAADLARHPRIVVTDLEARIGTRYTFDTIDYLVKRCPGTKFVWIMGADNLASFHHWQRWRDIAGLTPIAVVDRPASTLKAAHSRAAHFLARRRFDERDGALLADAGAPGFVFLHGPRSGLSSTELRRAGKGLTSDSVKNDQ